jgi:hypothetical protein
MGTAMASTDRCVTLKASFDGALLEADRVMKARIDGTPSCPALSGSSNGFHAHVMQMMTGLDWIQQHQTRPMEHVGLHRIQVAGRVHSRCKRCLARPAQIMNRLEHDTL